MVYYAAADVRLIIHTTLDDDDSEIESIIATSDAWIDKLLGSQSTSDALIQRLSILLTARAIKTRQPTATVVGEYRETHDPAKVWSEEIKEIIRLYRTPKVKGSTYRRIDEDMRYPG